MTNENTSRWFLTGIITVSRNRIKGFLCIVQIQGTFCEEQT
jgi:hypothetical protein